MRVPRHWTSAWDYIVAWPGHRDLSSGQWELLSQTFRVFYYFAHERRETIVTWPSFRQTYLLLGEMGKYFGEVVATCGDMQLLLLIAWANSRLPVRHDVSRCFKFKFRLSIDDRNPSGRFQLCSSVPAKWRGL